MVSEVYSASSPAFTQNGGKGKSLTDVHADTCVPVFGNCVTGTETVSQLARSCFPVARPSPCVLCSGSAYKTLHVCYSHIQLLL